MLKTALKVLIALIVVASIALTIFWFSRPNDLSFEAFRADVPNSVYSQFADVDGVRIHFQQKGVGIPLVLIHGFTSSTYTWKDIFEPLSQNFRVIAIDLKGFGFSGKPESDYSRRAQATLVLHLLDQLKIDQAWLCGNSMGGEVALNVALQSPRRVSGLILIDSAGIANSGGGSVAPAYLFVPVIGRILMALALTSDKLVREGMEKSFYDKAHISSERVEAYYRPLRTRAGQQAALRARIQAGQFPIDQDLNRITVPTLIIWGANDQLIPLEAGHKMNSQIMGSRLIVFEKCGHVPQEEMPERVFDEMSKFIALHPSA